MFSYSAFPHRDEASLFIVIVGDKALANNMRSNRHEKSISDATIVFDVLGVCLCLFIVFGNLMLVF